MSKGWDNATLKKLKALTVKGLSTAEIGKRLGISKNAVVGKLNRLGWNPKAGGVAAAMPEPASKAKADTKTAGRKTAAAAPAKKASSKVAAPKAGTPAKKATTTVKKTAAPKKATAPAKKPAAKDAEKTVAKGAEKTVASKPATKTSKAVNSKTLAMHQRIIQHSLEMANLKPNQCRWPIGDPDSENFHFCGEPVFVGKPYCYEHCKQAYQFTPPKKK